MDTNSKLDAIITDGSAMTAGNAYRNVELIEALGILAQSYDSVRDQHRKALLEAAITELEVCYATIYSLDLIEQQLEKEAGYASM
jgi:hypothetical protein